MIKLLFFVIFENFNPCRKFQEEILNLLLINAEISVTFLFSKGKMSADHPKCSKSIVTKG